MDIWLDLTIKVEASKKKDWLEIGVLNLRFLKTVGIEQGLSLLLAADLSLSSFLERNLNVK